MTVPFVSVVLPLHQQADQVEAIIDEYDAALSRLTITYELVLVVNGSNDDTMARCRALAERSTRIRAHQLAEAGWGRAVRHGLQSATGDVLCYTNSARTTADDLMRLVSHGLANPDAVVKANRKIRDNWRRRVGSLLFALECRALFDLANWDINGTPKVFPRRFAKLLELTRDDDLLDAEFVAACRRWNYPILEVPVFSTRRRAGRSTTRFRSALRIYWGAFQLWRAQRAQER